MEKNNDRLELCKALEKELKYSRFIHTLGVSNTAACLAMRHGADVQKAELAGLLHDCAKYMDPDKMEELCHKNGIPVSTVEHGSGALLHSKAGAILARTRYGVTDPEILSAIACHTTGKPDMTTLEKIIFIADYIEPGRCEAPNLPEIREMAFRSLDEALVKILSDTLEYLGNSDKQVDPMTRKTYDWYCK